MSRIHFEEFPLSAEVLQAITEMGYEKTTKIQAAAIPLMLEGKDVIGLSGTGTGKTAAFSIPAVESIGPEDARIVRVLILCPTRELAMQISGEVQKFSRHRPEIHVATVYGGQSIELQIRQLKNANIVVGTPGRIMDHMSRHTLKLEHLRTVILDEADEMLNMGFLEDIQSILSATPEERQTVLFSATMSDEIMGITNQFQKEPEIIKIGQDARSIDNIQQYYYEVPQTRKMDALNLVLQLHEPRRSVVFCNTKAMVDDLVSYLNSHGFKSEGIHGDMKQLARTRVMNAYKNGRTQILVATDVAARGIDVEDIEAVFNFDIPQEYEYYIHRIGRTARAGKTGNAFTFVCNQVQLRKLRDIAKYAGTEIVYEDLPAPEDITRKAQDALVARICKAMDGETPYDSEYVMEQLLSKGYDTWKIANTLVAMLDGNRKRTIPVVKALEKKRPANLSGAPTVTLQMNIGRNKRLAPNFVVGAIVEGTGIPARNIGKIDIYGEYTNIELEEADAKLVLKELQDSVIKGCTVHFKRVKADPFADHSKAKEEKPRHQNIKKPNGRRAPVHKRRK